jgi:hypothetical protein
LYLDRAGLVALWREALLAQKVLLGDTRGYRQHPQLQRFRAHPEPLAAIGSYLRGVASEAERRGYRFDRTKIRATTEAGPLEVTVGQLCFEWNHLLRKLRERDPACISRLPDKGIPLAHPLFNVIPGATADWERDQASQGTPLKQ